MELPQADVAGAGAVAGGAGGGAGGFYETLTDRERQVLLHLKPSFTDYGKGHNEFLEEMCRKEFFDNAKGHEGDLMLSNSGGNLLSEDNDTKYELFIVHFRETENPARTLKLMKGLHRNPQVPLSKFSNGVLCVDLEGIRVYMNAYFDVEFQIVKDKNDFGMPFRIVDDGDTFDFENDVLATGGGMSIVPFCRTHVSLRRLVLEIGKRGQGGFFINLTNFNPPPSLFVA